MIDYDIEYEWKTHPALNPKDVETQCAFLSKKGWKVVGFTSHNNVFYILAKRRKTDDRVYDSSLGENPSGEIWLNQQVMGSA